MRSIVWTSEPHARTLRAVLGPSEIVIGGAARAFVDDTLADSSTVSFIDGSTLAALDQATAERGLAADQFMPRGLVIAICGDDAPGTALRWLATYPWLSHVVSASMLELPTASERLGKIMSMIGPGRPKVADWFGPTAGRRVRIARSSRCADRLDRMSEYFSSERVDPPAIAVLRELASVLLTNAFYAAPVAAGALPEPISRTREITLPDNSACEIAYGCRDDLAIVRVRDPFGALYRADLIDLLVPGLLRPLPPPRAQSNDKAGEGLRRIVSEASLVAISVLNSRRTEFLVGVPRSPGPRSFGLHLFFKEQDGPVRRWKLLDADSSVVVTDSVTIVPR